jgi:2-hydroxy-3-keto-5-methylthiopentenyl-1-phosphate phosphatase
VPSIICLDFDDTVVLDNTARQLFERFADPAWRDRERDYHAGLLSVEQFNAAAFDLIDPEVTAEEMKAFVRQVARPRPGLGALIDWAHWNDWLVVVVSNGLDLYVDPVLDDLGFDRVARHAGRTQRGYRWRLHYYSPRGIEINAGFKISYAKAFRDAGDFVAYAGDGASDVAAARLAGAVFARDTLWERLKDEHPRIFHFETFDDVVAVLEREAAAWPGQPPLTGL